MKSKRYRDAVVEAYKSGVDRTLLRENLKLTPEQRLRKHQRALEMVEESCRVDKAMRGRELERAGSSP